MKALRKLLDWFVNDPDLFREDSVGCKPFRRSLKDGFVGLIIFGLLGAAVYAPWDIFVKPYLGEFVAGLGQLVTLVGLTWLLLRFEWKQQGPVPTTEELINKRFRAPWYERHDPGRLSEPDEPRS
jgi:hypothetical protein